MTCLGLAVPLLVYLLIGSNMRYSGDDYCYAATLTKYGFVETQRYAYLNISYYNGNRFSLNLLSALADLAGPYANGIWPGLAIAVWMAGLFLIFGSVSRITSVEMPTLGLLVASEILVFFTLTETTDIDQSLFWRSGMLPYLAPLITNTFLVLVLIRQFKGEIRSLPEVFLAVLLAFIGAGLSETAGLIQAVWLGVALFIGLVFFWRMADSRASSSRFCWITGVSLFSTLVALVVLAVSPTVLHMKPNLTQQTDLFGTLQLSMLYGRRFLSTLKTAPLENLYPAVFFMVLTVVVLQGQWRVKRIRLISLFNLLLGLAVVTYILIVTSMVAFSFAQQAYPEPRAEIIPRFILTIAEAVAGILAGIAAEKVIQRSRLANPIVFLAGVAMIALLGFPLWTGRVYWGELPRYQRWGAFWDQRDQEIRQAQNQGILDVHVMEIDHIIPRLVELTPNPADLYNQCAAVYYGFNTITADLPGWNE